VNILVYHEMIKLRICNIVILSNCNYIVLILVENNVFMEYESKSCAMPLSAADGLQSKEDSVRSDPTDVSTHPSLLFWKGVSGIGIDEEYMFS